MTEQQAAEVIALLKFLKIQSIFVIACLAIITGLLMAMIKNSR